MKCYLSLALSKNEKLDLGPKIDVCKVPHYSEEHWRHEM